MKYLRNKFHNYEELNLLNNEGRDQEKIII